MTKREKKLLFCALSILLDRCFCYPLGHFSPEEIEESNGRILLVLDEIKKLVEVLDD